MQCPICRDVSLVMTERQNVEIDYCPECRGVWLDRGELDKIIERSQQQYAARFIPPSAPQPLLATLPVDPPGYAQHGNSQVHSQQRDSHGGGWRDGHQGGGHQNQSGSHGQQGHRKKSFLREIFD